MTTLPKTARRLPHQAGYIRSLTLFSDTFHPGEPGYGSASSFRWTYDSRFKLSLLSGTRSEWNAFAKGDIAIWREDYGQNNDVDFEKWWLPRPSLQPVIVVEGTDGQFYVWDGISRIGIAILNERRMLPAVVGYRK